MVIQKLHQFVYVTKGIKNSAFINFLTGQIYSIENTEANIILNSKNLYESEYYNFLHEENLLVDIEDNSWIPRINFISQDYIKCIIEIESLDVLNISKSLLDNLIVSEFHLYGAKTKESNFYGIRIRNKEYNFKKCLDFFSVNKYIDNADINIYKNNLFYNTCWSHRLHLKHNGDILPSIYSDYVISNIHKRVYRKSYKKNKFYMGIQ